MRRAGGPSVKLFATANHFQNSRRESRGCAHLKAYGNGGSRVVVSGVLRAEAWEATLTHDT